MGVRNYAVAVAGFIALFSLSWWWIGARQYVGSWTVQVTMLTVCCSKYTGPRTKELLHIVDTEDTEAGPYSPEYRE